MGQNFLIWVQHREFLCATTLTRQSGPWRTMQIADENRSGERIVPRQHCIPSRHRIHSFFPASWYERSKDSSFSGAKNVSGDPNKRCDLDRKTDPMVLPDRKNRRVSWKTPRDATQSCTIMVRSSHSEYRKELLLILEKPVVVNDEPCFECGNMTQSWYPRI